MHQELLLVLGLLFAVILFVLLAQRIRVAYPIFLVIAGLGISIIPGIPIFRLDPDLIFLIFLPPLLYEAAWYTSWKDFWKWKRPIALLAFGLVFCTSLVVAYASYALIPDFTLALGFLLRYLWVYPATHIPRLLSAKIRKDPSPGWKGPLVISWAGMRGVVSLATALSIPLMWNESEAFPQRSLIIFITFIVIFITLVFQGLTLPFVFKLIKLKEMDSIADKEEQHAHIQLRLSKVALALINTKYVLYVASNELAQIYKENLENEVTNTSERLNSLECAHTKDKGNVLYQQMILDIIAKQRKELFLLKKEPYYADKEIRHAEFQLDLEELKITGMSH